MCYDISFETNMDELAEYIPRLQIGKDVDFQDREHVQAQAYSKYPIILQEEDQYQVKMMEWGIIPPYMNTPDKIKKGRAFMCNAQGEKIIHEKGSYWHRIRTHRCLIPVTGIYEHRHIDGWKQKVPYFVRIKNKNIFCIPGLYGYMPDPQTGEAKGMYTLITRAPNSLMEKIHNGGARESRMPLFLESKDLELKWIAPALTDKGIDEIIEHEIASDKLDHHPVFTIRSLKPRPDGKDKTAEWKWEGLPAL